MPIAQHCGHAVLDASSTSFTSPEHFWVTMVTGIPSISVTGDLRPWDSVHRYAARLS